MKGQFIIIGSLLLCIFFYVSVSPLLKPKNIIVSPYETINYFYKNIEEEYPHALNIGLNKSNEVAYLVNFTYFVKNVSKEHYTDFGILWIMIKNESGDLNITAGNFMDKHIEILLNVSGTAKNMSLNEDSVNSTVFTSVPSEFNLTLRFNNTEKKLLLEKDKVNFYSRFYLRIEENSMEGEIIS